MAATFSFHIFVGIHLFLLRAQALHEFDGRCACHCGSHAGRLRILHDAHRSYLWGMRWYQYYCKRNVLERTFPLPTHGPADVSSSLSSLSLLSASSSMRRRFRGGGGGASSACGSGVLPTSAIRGS